jgi:hypothetical protein
VEITKKIIRLISETMSENPKSHLHIPQSKKNLCVEHHHPKYFGKKRM